MFSIFIASSLGHKCFDYVITELYTRRIMCGVFNLLILCYGLLVWCEDIIWSRKSRHSLLRPFRMTVNGAAIAGWVSSRAGADGLEKRRRICCPCQESKHDFSTVQPVALWTYRPRSPGCLELVWRKNKCREIKAESIWPLVGRLVQNNRTPN
jgi:hypothetical protein